jgi:hypothetical protein
LPPIFYTQDLFEDKNMQRLQNVKAVNVTSPRVINDNTAYTTTTLDTMGFDEALFIVQLGALDIAVAALKLQESDDSGMSGAADITGADFSVSPATLPSASADDTFIGIHVKLGGVRKRYLDLSFTAGDGAAGTYASVLVLLSKAEAYPASVADRGFGQLLYV